MVKKSEIIVNSRKFDGKIHRSWKADFIERDNSLLKLVGEFEKEIEHLHLGVIRRKTVSYEYYWLDRWYNIFRFHEPNGALRNFYCNVNMPPTFENGILDYVDLDIDVLVWSDYTFEILDSDEFEENSNRFKYPPKIHKTVRESLEELQFMIENRLFPFNDF